MRAPRPDQDDVDADPIPAGTDPSANDRHPGLLVAYAPFAKWSPHFETDLELMQSHRDAGGEVLALACERKLRTCEPNPEHAAAVCALCEGRFRAGMAWLRGDRLRVRGFHALDADEQAQVDALARREWSDLAQVRAFRLEGADIGLAAISSLVSALRESEPDIALHRERLGALLATAATVYFSLRRQLAAQPVDALAIFNGRFAALRPALRAAQQRGIPAWVHERAGYVERFQVSLDTYPHDLAAIKRGIETCVPPEGLDDAQRQAALDWFAQRRAGVVQSWHSFTAAQEAGRVPESLGKAVLDVGIFNSSEDEFVAIEEWTNPFYATQNEGIERLLADLGDDPRIQFHLRMHPNLSGQRNTQMAGLAALQARFPRLTVIPADSKVSTYALLDAVDIVLSYGSTIGIEACHAGKPSVLMGHGMYEDLGVATRPRSHAELVALLDAAASGRMPPPPVDPLPGILKFGHYQNVRGQAFAHLVPDGLFAARMRRDGREVAIRAPLPVRARYKLFCLWRLLADKLRGRPPR